ncbi:type I DNA topoisomerase [Longimicrobium sp.]|uniref:type I DNA topoisomerase n=1 Tax=Longimicrobium sp. TaxID=2029185 RepID=UPI002C4703E8|nr:type I DNA topoisomerase [Longimicrobium sp.]HSU13205.1 type I DNA topoisomerase [Longimicrobium sp.]
MADKKKTRLVVVESPTKAKTIRSFLPAGYRVAASMGHVRDLPESASEIPATLKGQEWARLGVNVDNDFEPVYVIPGGKRKVVSELRELLKDADELVVATDEDREGESIGWHLVEVLKPKVPCSRIVFHEITPEAIRAALEHPRRIDDDLVRAQETRRILDRLVGYTVSPLLWKKIATGLSAGRVQSVAVRLLVVRERERRAFRSAVYWDLKASLLRGVAPFSAMLQSVGGKRVATGRDFDENTGRLKTQGVVLLGSEEATALRERLQDAAWKVVETEEKPSIRRPYPPFTTSTLQQEANRKLRLSSRDTMRIAQRLYEEGFITYMRTDSVHLSDQAMKAARTRIRALYGEEYLSPSPRQFTTTSKGAQEAHEAIRPAGTEMRTPEETGLRGQEAALYELIWKRTVASQMADARQTHLTALIEAADAVFRASGKRIDFPGFFRAYVEGSDDPDAALEDREEPLPPLARGDSVALRGLEALKHETQPPARYTEATLVKMLEAEGIGRPSTYASIIGTIIDRGYVERVSNQLVPTFTAFAVTTLLEKNFPHLVDTRFTARMEEQLDEIAEGEAEWLPYLRDFFSGPEGLGEMVNRGQAEIDPREASTVHLEGLPARVRIGRFGPFVEREEGEGTVTASLPDGIAPADLSEEQVERLVRAKTEGPEKLGIDPDTGKPVLMLEGRFGPYVQLGEATEDEKKPKRASLPKGMNPAEVTLEMALRWLSLPRTLGKHPDDGEEVKAGIGRFGPFVVHGNDFRSLEKTDDVYTVAFERAIELLSKPKGGRGQRKAIEPLRTLGAHPANGEPVTLWEGRYGPYVKHGDVNASLPKGVSPDDFTLEAAVPLLAERALTAKPAKGRRGAAKRGAASSPRSTTRTAKSAATKASAAKKPSTAKPKSKTAASAKKAAAKKATTRRAAPK